MEDPKQPQDEQQSQPQNPETPQAENQAEAAAPTGDMSFNARIDLSALSDAVAQIKSEIGKIIVGQEQMVELLVISLLANGHSLIEGVPGVAKTVTAKLLAKSLNVNFNRIQFTPDLMPSDILGTSIFNVKDQEFEFKAGPIFSNIVLIDEINRAPAKTQAALFEVMAERQITIDGVQNDMEQPFLVFATQNPIEQEGTYALPEAQLDRFLFKINVDYPALEEEILILKNEHHREDHDPFQDIQAVLSAEKIIDYQQTVKKILIEDNLIKYIAELVNQTRTNPNLYLGASPRASIAIMNSAKAKAAIEGRDFVTPDDIKTVTVPVLRHRVIVTPEREMEGFTADRVIAHIIESQEIPR
ncbi:AAA family ATPase [Gilvibacter sp.]|uniref:AAA family ATPase n=1 Tax=Gilvibacter sp. TaxID=2729997 RepID=UPI003F4A72E2